MNLAVIADIHSNYLALEAVLRYVDGIRPDGIIFLGDYVSDCPYPERTMALIYGCRKKYDCHFVRGNREDYMSRHRKNPGDGWCYSSQTGSLLYTYENLTLSDLDFFEGMPKCLDIKLDGGPAITACHGSPADTRECILGKPELIDKYTKEIAGDILLCGHNHRSAVAEANRKTVIFCPSVSVSVSLNPGSRSYSGFLLLESDRGVWHRREVYVDYDRDRLVSEFYASGLRAKGGFWAGSIMKSIIEQGYYSSYLVKLAYVKAKEDGHPARGILPEKYWEEAARELSIV